MGVPGRFPMCVVIFVRFFADWNFCEVLLVAGGGGVIFVFLAYDNGMGPR